MAATEYNEQSEYAKHLKKQCSDCEECEGSECDECKEECGCCPPGLVSVEDKDGKQIGCMTPNDAELFNIAQNQLCAPGYVKLFNAAGDFLGCVSESEFPTLYPLVNP